MTTRGKPQLLWWLNADAEFELADPRGYRVSPRMAAHCADLAKRLAPEIAAWCGGAVTVVGPAERATLALPIRAVAWSPTPVFRKTCAQRGWAAGPSPEPDILRATNHRRFAAGFDPEGLPGARFCATAAEVLEIVAQPPPPDSGASAWLLKRGLGFAGRWRKVLRGDATAADRTWIEASMHAYGGGLQIEPLVTLLHEWSTHGWIGRHGDVVLGEATRFATDERGAWLPDAPVTGLLDADTPAAAPLAAALRATRTAAAGIGTALHAAGYFGPFGVDSFLWRDADAALRLRAVSEVNARYTTRWFAGMRACGPLPDDPRSNAGTSPSGR